MYFLQKKYTFFLFLFFVVVVFSFVLHLVYLTVFILSLLLPFTVRTWWKPFQMVLNLAPLQLSVEKWRFGEPNNYNDMEHCVEVELFDGNWNDCFCEAYKNWICQIRKGPAICVLIHVICTVIWIHIIIIIHTIIIIHVLTYLLLFIIVMQLITHSELSLNPPRWCFLCFQG